jgi:hypothetical protein
VPYNLEYRAIAILNCRILTRRSTILSSLIIVLSASGIGDGTFVTVRANERGGGDGDRCGGSLSLERSNSKYRG